MHLKRKIISYNIYGILHYMWSVLKSKMNTFFSPCCCPQLPSEYETNPELLFYRITHLNHRQQYLIWAAAVTTAGRGNFSDKVTVEPAAKGESLNMKLSQFYLCSTKS